VFYKKLFFSIKGQNCQICWIKTLALWFIFYNILFALYILQQKGFQFFRLERFFCLGDLRVFPARMRAGAVRRAGVPEPGGGPLLPADGALSRASHLAHRPPGPRHRPGKLLG
jgi:hypothetical protein